MSDKETISTIILGQLSVMQSVIMHLPDTTSMLEFVCRGMKDISGVEKVDCVEFNGNLEPNLSPEHSNESEVDFMIEYKNCKYAHLRMKLLNHKEFLPYLPFVENFISFLGLIFEEHHQRKLNTELMNNLQRHVSDRTQKLEEEIIKRQQIEHQLRATNQKLEAKILQLRESEKLLQAANLRIETNNKQLLKSEKALIKEKLFSEKVVETANAFIVGLDKNHLIKIFNAGAEQITGYKKEEVIGKDWFKLFIVKPEIKDMLSVWDDSWKQPIHSHSNSIVCKSGEERIISWQNTTIGIDEDIRNHIMLSIGEDITERKKSESKLKESEERLKNAQALAKIGNWELDLQTNKLFWSDEIYRIFNLQPNQFDATYEAFLDNIHPADRDKVNKAFTDSVKNRTPYDIVHRLLLPHGEVKYVIEHCETYYDRNGNPLRSVGTVQDITERKTAEILQIESEQKYKILFEKIPVAIGISDKQGKIQDANSAMLDLLGLNSHELSKLDIHKAYVDPKEKDRLLTELKQGGAVRDFETKMYQKDGNIRDVLVNVDVISLNNEELFLSSVRDITKKKQAENIIMEGSSNLKAVLDNRRDSIWSLDCDYNYIIFNKTYEDIIFREHGIRLKKGMNALDVNPKEALDFWKSKFEPVFKGKVVYFEFEHFMEDRMHYFEVFLNPIISDNRITGASALSIDVTERKLSENEYHRQKDMFELVINSAHSRIYWKDLNLAYMGCNVHYANDMGIEKTSDLIGKKDEDLYWKKTTDKGYEEEQEIIKSGLPKLNQTEVFTNYKGEKLIWLSNKMPLKNADGEIIGVISISDDITEEKKAVQALKDSEERFELAMRATEDGLFDWNLLTNEIYYSPGWKSMLGYKEDELPNSFSVWEDLIAPEYKERSWEMQRELVNKQRDRFEIEFKMKHKDGHWVDILSRAEAVFDKTGKAIRMVGTHLDISERKKFEENLTVALEKAKESDRLKSAFLANMSHEIRTPMNGIMGFTGLLKERNLTGKKRDEFIQIIEESGERMLNTINDIIDISKIEAGQVEFYYSQVSVNKIIAEQYQFFNREAMSKGIVLNYKSFLLDTEVIIETDQRKLEGILINLIKNAIKYTREGEVSFGCSIKKLEKHSVLEFFVKDTGIGIPSNRLKAIFNRFEQADIEDEKVYEGSGLGLAISKSYAEMLGGEINVFSEVGIGSTFVFSIPYKTL